MKQLCKYISETERIFLIDDYILEAFKLTPISEVLKIKPISEVLKINSKSKVNTYNYHPKDKEELIKLIYHLIQKRGNEANLNDIDTSEITNMDSVFNDNDIVRNFNGDISKWDVSNVTRMNWMFYHSKFTGENGDISDWDVSNVRLMNGMFAYSFYNGDISKWSPPKGYKYNLIFKNCPLEKHPPKWY